MNKENINRSLKFKDGLNTSLELIEPGKISSMETAQSTISLLKQTYTEHALSNDVRSLADSIENGNVITWLVKKDCKLIATTSLIKTGDSWEGGRSVCILPSQGIGGKLMRIRTKFHFENHHGQALIGEVRVADEFKGIPSGQATQQIWFKDLGILPHALAPLFQHGEPLRKETFALVSSNKSRKIPISLEVNEAINNRIPKGPISDLVVNKNAPFNQIQPCSNGQKSEDVIAEATNNIKTSLFIIEATDQNLPLITQLMASPDILLSGVDRSVGQNGLPVILFTTFKKGSLIAPSKISNSVPADIRKDMQHISDQFTSRGKK